MPGARAGRRVGPAAAPWTAGFRQAAAPPQSAARRRGRRARGEAQACGRRGGPVRGRQRRGGGGGRLLQALCPVLQAFGGGDPAAERNVALETLTSGLASMSRLPMGVRAGNPAPAPPAAEMLVLYEFEACPFCRRVREALVDLDLEVTVRPCPKGSVRHRGEVLARGGRATFPFFVDEAAGVALYESSEIVAHLYREYGPPGAEVPPWIINGTLVTGWMPTLLRAGRGMTRYERAPDEAPEAPLELYNYEGNQVCNPPPPPPPPPCVGLGTGAVVGWG